MEIKDVIIKSNTYKVDLNGKTYVHKIELMESGASQYGNQTCVAHYYAKGEEPLVYDTRYEVGIIKHFDEWCNDYLKGWLDPACEFEKIEPQHFSKDAIVFDGQFRMRVIKPILDDDGSWWYECEAIDFEAPFTREVPQSSLKLAGLGIH